MTFIDHEGILEGTDGRRIGWLERGPADGRSVGYLHGMPGSRRDLNGIYSDEALERARLRVFAIDRAGYGDTDAAGLDRRDVARDLLTVADHLGIERFPVIAVSMGGTYGLTAATLAPDRVEKLVLVVPQALPYDDPEVVAALSEGGQAEVAAARRGPTPEMERAYIEEAAQIAAAGADLVRSGPAGWSQLERDLVTTPFADHVGASISYGVSNGHTGYYEDALRTVRPLEVELTAVRCPVRIVFGSRDDWEPAVNVHRLAAQLDDVILLELHGMGHFGAWVWPDLVLALVNGG